MEETEIVLSYIGFDCFPVDDFQRKLVTLFLKTFLGFKAEDFECVCEMVQTVFLPYGNWQSSDFFISCNYLLLKFGRNYTQLSLFL